MYDIQDEKYKVFSMLKKFLFENKLTLPAKLLMFYLFLGIVIFSIITEYPLSGVLNILFGRGYSIQPFAYSLLFAFFIYIPYLYLSDKYINTKSNIVLIYVYLTLFTIGTTIYMWMHTENGWQPLILMMALMFYPNKYIFVSNLMLLTYVIFKGKNREKIKENRRQSVRIMVAFFYLCLASGIPYFFKWQNITILEKASKQVEMSFNCPIEENILKTKECIDNIIIKKNNSLSTKWDNLIYRFKNPHRKIRHSIYNKNFVEVSAVLTDKFNSIKQCYTIDKCRFSSKYVPIEKGLRYDIYQNSQIRTESLGSGNFAFYAAYDNKKRINASIPNSKKTHYDSSGKFKQYIESKITGKKDVILSQTNGTDEFWAVGLEYIPLMDNNYFIIVSIPRYVEQGKNKYGEYLFEYTKGYKFYTSCKGKNCYEQDLEISLDSRDDPSIIYIHFGNNVYKINIP